MQYTPLSTLKRRASFVFIVLDDYRAPVSYTDIAANAKIDCKIDIYNGAGSYFGTMVQNRSGLYYAPNLPDGSYEALVSATDFITKKVAFTVTGAAPALGEIRLQPGYHYWFGEDATCIRGLVLEEGSSQPVGGARVEAQGKTESAYTDEAGRFVLYFKPGVIAAAGEALTLNFTHSSYNAASHIETAFTEKNRITLGAAIRMAKYDF